MGLRRICRLRKGTKGSKKVWFERNLEGMFLKGGRMVGFKRKLVSMVSKGEVRV